MSEYRIVEAKYSKRGYCTTAEIFQWNHGNVLRLVDFPELPEAFEIHFAPVGDDTAMPMIGTNGEVDIPDDFVWTGDAADILAWLYLHDAETDGETKFVITIPMNARAKPEDVEPTTEQATVIEQAITTLNTAVEETAEAQAAAESAAEAAETSAGHYPIISDGYWMVWDAATETYVSTGVEAQGPRGNKGDTGDTPNIQIGTVATGEAGRDAAASMTGTPENPLLNLTLPKGDKGDPGEAPIDDTAGEGDTDVVWSADKMAKTTTGLTTRITDLEEIVDASYIIEDYEGV